jgi:23S rRNA (uracil1939-C5)-methyltransferase
MSSGTFELELDAMAHGGSALGRHGKQIVFVPYTIPGERVEARIVSEKGRVAFAEGVRLLDVSADRVYPRCPHFGPGRCGRCQWQHIDYAAQTLLKQDVLADQLSRVGSFDDATIEAALRPIIPAPQPWEYNYHMTLRIGPDGRFGFRAAGDGERTFAISECHILHPDLLNLYNSLDLDFTGANRMTLQMGSDGAQMLILSVDDENDVPELLADLAVSINALLPDNEPVNLIGDSHVRYTVNGRSFRVTAGSSFRPNLPALGGLADAVLAALDLKGGEGVLDLYAGVGFFGAFAADAAGLVTVIESYPPAATDADDNLAELDHVDVIEGAVEDVLPELEETYDAALLDPPGSGLSAEAVDLLAESGIPRLVYVSSDAATLARDAQRLVRHGFRLESVQALDLAPQTYTIDTVAVLSR